MDIVIKFTDGYCYQTFVFSPLSNQITKTIFGKEKKDIVFFFT